MTKISQYASMITLSPNDLIDVSEWNGVTFDSRSLSYTNLIGSLTADLPLTDNSIYDIDGTLTGPRAVDGGGFDLTFTNLPVFSIGSDLAVDTDTLYVQSGTNRVGIGTSTPGSNLDVQLDGGGSFIIDRVASFTRTLLTGSDDRLIELQVQDTSSKTLSIGIRGTNDVIGGSAYGNLGDSFIYSGATANALNIISQIGGTTDNIGLYAGGDVNSLPNADLHIHGNGATRGFVGVNTDAPTEQLEVAGQVKITGGVPGTGKVLTSDALGVGAWATPAVGPGIPVVTFQTLGVPATIAKNSFTLITFSGLTVNLTTADVTTEGYSIWVKLGVAGNVTIQDDGGNPIDGALTQIINNQYNVLQFVSDGAGFWHIASNFA